MRKRFGLVLAAAVALAPVSALAWHFGRGGGLAQFIDYITSSVTTSAATAFMAIGPTGNCPFSVTLADVPALSLTVTATAAEIAAGDFQVGSVLGTAYTGVENGPTVINVNPTTDVLTLNMATVNTTDEPNQGVVVTPPYPAQWTFPPAATVNQPQGAENAAGTVLATGTTADGSNQITGLSFVPGSISLPSAIAAGDQIYGAGVPAGATVVSISGTTVTMSLSTGASDASAGAGQQVIFSPLAPLIHQYHTGSPGVLATGYISGTTFTVSSFTSGAFAIGDLLTGTGIDPATTIVSGSGGVFRVSVSQTVASSGSPENIDGTAQATTYTTFNAAFPQPGAQTWVAGDTFIADPAIYTDLDGIPVNDAYIGPNSIGNSCYQSATETYLTNTITCPTVFGTPEIGDYVYEATGGYTSFYYAPDTTITNIQPNTPSAGITTFTLSNDYVGPTVTGTATVVFDRSIENITVWGAVTNDSNGVATRPVMQQFNGNAGANTQYQGLIYFGSDGERGIASGILFGNIDVNAPSWMTHPGLGLGLVYIPGPFEGTNTFQDMRIDGGVYEFNQSFNSTTGDNGVEGANNPLAANITISGTITPGDIVSVDFWDNSGQCLNTTEASAGKVSYTVVSGDTPTTIAAGLVQSYVTNNASVLAGSHGYYMWAKGPVITVTYGSQELCSTFYASTSGTETLTDAYYIAIPGRDINGTLNFLNDELSYDGGQSGPRHAIYVGEAPNLTVNLENSWIHDIYWGHDFKSRAGTNNVIGNYLDDNVISFYGNSGGNSEDLDFACGGHTVIKNNIMIKTLSGENTGSNNIRWMAEYPFACLQQSGISLDLHNNTILDFSATRDGNYYDQPIQFDGPDWYNNMATNVDTCLGAVIFYGDNIVEVPTADYTGFCSIDEEHEWIEDNTSAATIPTGTWAGPTGISHQGRTCPSGYYCTFMNVNATAASAAGGDSVTMVFSAPMMPGDRGWPLTAANSWDIKNNLFAGACHDVGQPEPAGTPNAGLNVGNFGWYGTQPSNSGGSVGVEVTMALSQLSQLFSPTPKYAPSGDTSNVGAADYLHAAISGGTRALPTIGAVD